MPDGRFRDGGAWDPYITEWRMAWTEQFKGFLIAGAIAATATLQAFEKAG